MYGKSEQKVYGKSEQVDPEKYARTPESVLFDKGLSITARCVYGVLARYAYQGTTVKIGQRRIAKLLGVHLETVNVAIHELEDRQHIAIRGDGKVRRAARAVGIAPKTLVRWMKEPEFDAGYRAARRAAFGQSVARLQQASSAAVSTLVKVMIDPNTPASSRVRAADSVLNHAARAIEIEDIEVRVANLERAAEESRTATR